MSEHNGRGRKCTICQHTDREHIERALASGTMSIRGIATHFQIGREPLRQHVRSHLAPAMRDAVLTVPGIAPVALARGLLDSLTTISDAIEDAEERGLIGLVFRGAEARARVTGVLADRLGITSADALRDLAAAEVIANAMGLLALRNPAAGLALAAVFTDINRPDLADDVRAQITKSEATKGELTT